MIPGIQNCTDPTYKNRLADCDDHTGIELLEHPDGDPTCTDNIHEDETDPITS